MRVIILADLADMTGGAQKVAAQSAQALAQAGAEAILVVSTAPAGDITEDGVRRIGLGLPDVWDLPLHRGALAGVWNKAAARALGALLERLREPETLVHLHQWTRAFSPSVFAVLRTCTMPYAITLHDYSLFCPNGVYYRFDVARPCALEPLSVSCLAAPCDPRSSLHKIVRVARSFRTRQAISDGGFDLVHVSQRGADTARKALPAALNESVRHHVIDNPVMIAQSAPAQLHAGARFAYIGRLTVEKGAVLAAQAARAADVPILFIGEGPAEAAIRAAHPEAELAGQRSPDQLAGLLAGDIRAVLAPSLWQETGPLTVYEAQARGVAVIASKRSGAADRVRDGVTGLVVEPDVESFSSAMRALADQPRAMAMGAAAHAHYWTKPPTLEAHGRNLMTLYADMLARAKSCGSAAA